MKYVIDAQLPRRMVQWLTTAGEDVVHTADLSAGNRTTDTALITFADQEKRVVVTKDDDFVDSHILLGRPAKLLLISTGNISNSKLEALFVPLIASIAQAFETNSLLELGRSGLVIRH